MTQNSITKKNSFKPRPLIWETQVAFGDCDPAGILYFARVFDYAHKAFEAFITETKIGWSYWFKESPDLVPIRRAEADFYSPFFPGAALTVQIQVSLIQESSFQMVYAFFCKNKLLAEVKMVHVFADPKTLKKKPIPENIRKEFSRFLIQSSGT